MPKNDEPPLLLLVSVALCARGVVAADTLKDRDGWNCEKGVLALLGEKGGRLSCSEEYDKLKEEDAENSFDTKSLPFVTSIITATLPMKSHTHTQQLQKLNLIKENST